LLALTLVAVNQTARARHESRLARLSLASRALVDADRLVIERVVDSMDDEVPTFERDLLRRMLAVGQSGMVPMTCLDWDVVDGIGLGIFEDASAPVHGPMLAQVVDGHVTWSMPIVSAEVGALALSADRTRALVCTQGGHVAWHEFPIGKALALPLGSGNAECNQGSITQTGSGHLVCAGTTVHVIEPGGEDASWSLEPNLGLIRDLAASPSDPSMVLLGAEEGVLLLDVASRAVRTLGEPGERARAVAWSLDGRVVLVASRTLTAFDASTGVRMWTAQGHQSGVWGVVALDHGRCATASADGSIRVWSMKDGTAIGALPLSSDRLWSLGTDGDVLSTGGSLGAYTVTHREVSHWFGSPGGSLAFDVQPGVGSVDAAGRDQVRISTPQDPARIVSVPGIGVVKRSSIGPSGDLIALAGDSGAVMLLRSDGSPIWTDRGHGSPDDVHEPQGFRSIDIGPGHGHVLLGARQFGTVCLDRVDGHVRWITRLPSECESVTWSHDGHRAFLVTREGGLVTLDGRDGRVLQSVQPFKQGAGAVTVSADGSRVLAGSGEGALVVFEADTLAELIRIPVMQRVIEHLWIDDDGVHLVDVDGHHLVR
jgi:WD40 repeat protein